MNTVRTMRDLAIAILAIYILVVSIYARTSPAMVGEWLAKRDLAYEAMWADCDCTESLEQKNLLSPVTGTSITLTFNLAQHNTLLGGVITILQLSIQNGFGNNPTALV